MRWVWCALTCVLGVCLVVPFSFAQDYGNSVFSLDTQGLRESHGEFVLPVSEHGNSLDIDVNVNMAMNDTSQVQEPSKSETQTDDMTRKDRTRKSGENPVMSIAKGTVWGGLGGLIIGMAIAAAVPGGPACEIMRWLFVSGTAAGFGYGIYDVTDRPQTETGLTQIDRQRLAAQIP